MNDIETRDQIIADLSQRLEVAENRIKYFAGVADTQREAMRLLSAKHDDEMEQLKGERDKALSNYQFMVERACDEKLGGYRELGAKCASLAEERDEARRGVTVLKAEVERLKVHTWQQERAAIVAWLRDTIYDPARDRLAERVEAGEHWPGDRPW